MAHKYSFVTLWDGDKITGTLTVLREKGLKMQQILDGEIEPDNEAQAAFVLRIKSIHPKSKPTCNRREIAVEKDALKATEHLYHEGIEQGMGQALPSGDR